MIPKIIQFHWFSKHCPKWVIRNYSEYERRFPGWDVRFYSQWPTDMPDVYQEAAANVKSSRLRADIARYWLMYRDGGFYVDADTLPLRSFDLLQEYDCFLPRIDNSFIDICFLGSVPKHQLWLDALDGCLSPSSWYKKAACFWIVNAIPDLVHKQTSGQLHFCSSKEKVNLLDSIVALSGHPKETVSFCSTDFNNATPWDALNTGAYIKHFNQFVKRYIINPRELSVEQPELSLPPPRQKGRGFKSKK